MKPMSVQMKTRVDADGNVVRHDVEVADQHEEFTLHCASREDADKLAETIEQLCLEMERCVNVTKRLHNDELVSWESPW